MGTLGIWEFGGPGNLDFGNFRDLGIWDLGTFCLSDLWDFSIL